DLRNRIEPVAFQRKQRLLREYHLQEVETLFLLTRKVLPSDPPGHSGTESSHAAMLPDSAAREAARATARPPTRVRRARAPPRRHAPPAGAPRSALRRPWPPPTHGRRGHSNGAARAGTCPSAQGSATHHEHPCGRSRPLPASCAHRATR